jgi:hypothetical protein
MALSTPYLLALAIADARLVRRNGESKRPVPVRKLEFSGRRPCPANNYGFAYRSMWICAGRDITARRDLGACGHVPRSHSSYAATT